MDSLTFTMITILMAPAGDAVDGVRLMQGIKDKETCATYMNIRKQEIPDGQAAYVVCVPVQKKVTSPALKLQKVI